MSEAERIDLVDRAPLTEKQQNVYESIMQYQRVNGYAPTIREICKMVGIPTLYLLLKQWYLMTMGSQSSNAQQRLRQWNTS